MRAHEPAAASHFVGRRNHWTLTLLTGRNCNVTAK